MNGITRFTMTGKDGMTIQVMRIELSGKMVQSMIGDCQEQRGGPWHPLSAVPGNPAHGNGVPVSPDPGLVASVIEDYS